MGIKLSALTEATQTLPNDLFHLRTATGIDKKILFSNLIPSGIILPYGGTSVPSGYLLCDGSSLLRATYAALFAIIGTAFGIADGTHFNIPDLRGYFLRGRCGDGITIDPDKATRTELQAGGNIGDNVGSKQLNENKSHRHATGASYYQSGFSLNANRFAYYYYAPNLYTKYTGGNESRPINVYVNYIIKY